MNTYRTSEIAQHAGIHPNTVRLYEKLGLIPKAHRRANGYRVFTDLHMDQIICARTALKVEVLQNGLRKRAIEIIKTSASGDITKAIWFTQHYALQIRGEQKNAEDAIAITEKLLSDGGSKAAIDTWALTRKQTADYLQVSVDTLRNWEMNGLLSIKRRKNGYRIYSHEDIRRLKIIRSLRCANYSLSAILRMLNALSGNPEANIQQVIDTPGEHDDIITVCDKLITSLQHAGRHAEILLDLLRKMKKKYGSNPPL